MDDFIYSGNWFDKKYRLKSGLRYPTMKAALNFLYQIREDTGTSIVETGCARLEEDWGGGMSTLLFADYAYKYRGKVRSVDISEESCRTAREVAKDFPGVVDIRCMDSVKFLKTLMPGSVDLLYLDSYDYPYGELLEIYGGKQDIEKAADILVAMSEEEIIEKHGDLIKASQNHCLNEIQAAMPSLHNNSIVLIDDNDIPGGGKPRLAKRWLVERGWICVLDSTQTLWIRR